MTNTMTTTKPAKRLNLSLNPNTFAALLELITYWDDVNNMSDTVRRCIVEARDREVGVRMFNKVAVPANGEERLRLGEALRGSVGAIK